MSFHFFNILMKNHDVFDAYQDRILISVFCSGVLHLLCHHYHLKYANRLSLLLGRKLQVTTSLLQVLFINSKHMSASSKYMEPTVK